MTLASEDAYSKLEVVTVAGVGDKDCVGNSLLQIWKLRFGHKSYLLFRLWALWSRFWSSSSGEILKLKFGEYFAADVWFRLRSWILVNIPKLDLVKILTLDLVEMLMFGCDFEVNAPSRSWNCNIFKICKLWTVILWYELNPRVRCAFGNVSFKTLHLFRTMCWVEISNESH